VKLRWELLVGEVVSPSVSRTMLLVEPPLDVPPLDDPPLVEPPLVELPLDEPLVEPLLAEPLLFEPLLVEPPLDEPPAPVVLLPDEPPLVEPPVDPPAPPLDPDVEVPEGLEAEQPTNRKPMITTTVRMWTHSLAWAATSPRAQPHLRSLPRWLGGGNLRVATGRWGSASGWQWRAALAVFLLELRPALALLLFDVELRPAVALPAGLGVLRAKRRVLAIADAAHALYAEILEVLLHGVGPALPQGEVVLLGPALIADGMRRPFSTASG
jgi:hypothetical protein